MFVTTRSMDSRKVIVEVPCRRSECRTSTLCTWLESCTTSGLNTGVRVSCSTSAVRERAAHHAVRRMPEPLGSALYPAIDSAVEPAPEALDELGMVAWPGPDYRIPIRVRFQRVVEHPEVLGPELQVVIDRRDETSARIRDPAERRAGLAVIRQQVHADDAGMVTGQLADHRPGRVRRRVVHQHDLATQSALGKQGLGARHQLGSDSAPL